jgi:catechol 2,3-dioxygenase-like lactoylglutathione lyase family enzyme
MTDRKDFKRVVRARARRTGETYSSALRNLRSARSDRPAATGTAALSGEVPPVSITRAIPDVRSTNVDKTISFYTEVLGFDVRSEDGRVDGFVSATHPGVEVTLNRDAFSLPPGFTIEVDTFEAVQTLHERASTRGVRVIEPADLQTRECTVLDPSGRRVTIAAASGDPLPSVSGDATRPITRAIPGVGTNDLEATRRFYVDYLGFDVPVAVDGVAIFRTHGSPAQLIGSTMESASPDGFDLDVGTVDRVDRIYREAKGYWIVLGEPADSPQHGIRCFTVFDPNGLGINVAALLGT